MTETNLEQFKEVTPQGRFTPQNSSMLKVRLEGDEVQALLGSMVAYQVDVKFEHKSGGLGRFVKKALTGEGVQMMTANGRGDLFLAQDKRKIMLIDLDNERMTVNGQNILAFEPGIDWDIPLWPGVGESGPTSRRMSRSRHSSGAEVASPSRYPLRVRGGF